MSAVAASRDGRTSIANHNRQSQIQDFTMRDIIHLACGDCKRRNYSTTKNKKKTTERLEFSKFCRFCRKHTAHKETK
jgi:large subunit ribosomal protein L33